MMMDFIWTNAGNSFFFFFAVPNSRAEQINVVVQSSDVVCIIELDLQKSSYILGILFCYWSVMCTTRSWKTPCKIQIYIYICRSCDVFRSNNVPCKNGLEAAADYLISFKALTVKRTVWSQVLLTLLTEISPIDLCEC